MHARVSAPRGKESKDLRAECLTHQILSNVYRVLAGP
jgi:hypothetical protein